MIQKHLKSNNRRDHYACIKKRYLMVELCEARTNGMTNALPSFSLLSFAIFSSETKKVIECSGRDAHHFCFDFLSPELLSNLLNTIRRQNKDHGRRGQL